MLNIVNLTSKDVKYNHGEIIFPRDGLAGLVRQVTKKDIYEGYTFVNTKVEVHGIPEPLQDTVYIVDYDVYVNSVRLDLITPFAPVVGRYSVSTESFITKVDI